MSVALGLLVIASAAVGVAALTGDVLEGDGVAVLDHPVGHFVAAHRNGVLTTVMQAVSAAGDPAILAAVTAGAGVGVIRRSSGPVVVAGVTAAGIGALTMLFKEVLGRPRPPLAEAVATAGGHAFPSGHAATAAATFGVLAYLSGAVLRRHAAQVAVWAAAAVLATSVGLSRVHLGCIG